VVGGEWVERWWSGRMEVEILGVDSRSLLDLVLLNTVSCRFKKLQVSSDELVIV
jgi:hypothetical protein